MHSLETKHTTNTARLAPLTLSNCEIRLRGNLDYPLQLEDLTQPEANGLLLYPTDDAIELTPDYVAKLARPLTLVVPDGSWPQAKKVTRREPLLAHLPRVKLPLGPPSRYRLRREIRDDQVCTFEAIARALGIFEGKPVQEQLERDFDLFVERVLWTRGDIRRERCEYSIPQEALETFRQWSIEGQRRARGLIPSS